MKRTTDNRIKKLLGAVLNVKEMKIAHTMLESTGHSAPEMAYDVI